MFWKCLYPKNAVKLPSVQHCALNRLEMTKAILVDSQLKTMKFKRKTKSQSFKIIQDFKKVLMLRFRFFYLFIFFFWLVYSWKQQYESSGALRLQDIDRLPAWLQSP